MKNLFKPNVHRLKNGLTIVVVEIPNSPSVTVEVMVRAGAQNDPKNKLGLSHFLEHMQFKGTKSRPTAIDIAKELDSIGAVNNASTSHEVTSFYVKGVVKHLDQLIDVVSDMFMHSTLPELEIEKERNVIFQEMTRYEDSPQREVHRILNSLMYSNQPAGRNVLGERDHLSTISRKDLIKYKKKYYVSGNTIVIVGGGILDKEVYPKIKKAFRDVERGDIIKSIKIKNIQKRPEVELKKKKTSQTQIALGFKVDLHSSKDKNTLMLLSGLLGSGSSSLLFSKIREDLGLCYSIFSYVRLYKGKKSLIISAGVQNEYTGRVLQEISNIIRSIKANRVAEENLTKVKEYMLSRMYMSLESSEVITSSCAGYVFEGEKIKTIEEEESEVRKITVDDIYNMAQIIFQDNKMNLAVIGPHKNGETLLKNLKV